MTVTILGIFQDWNGPRCNSILETRKEMEVDIFWKVLVDSCSCPVRWLGYAVNAGFTWKAPPFSGIHSGDGDCELRRAREGVSLLFSYQRQNALGCGNAMLNPKFQLNSSPLKCVELNLMPHGSNFNLKVAL